MHRCCNHNCRQGRDCPRRSLKDTGNPARAVRRALWWLLRALPVAFERVHLQWALREMDPVHPDIPFVVRRLRELDHG